MGWFSTKMDNNRMATSAGFMVCSAMLGANAEILEKAETFTNQQISRGNTLVGQTYALQGTASKLGRELLQAIGNLRQLNHDIGDLKGDLLERAHQMIFLANDYDKPRLLRQTGMSGKDMVEFVAEMTDESIGNLQLLANRNPNFIADIQTLDRADSIVNGTRATRAANSIPMLEFEDLNDR
ncbi:hypothetical protein NQT62_02255 [Limnobacter humi]|uniref:Uncharacterized protein n=1 Tax=Limnobacter humi TaxID=1778671 RepID=A0ABT1WCK8_9BURK|nr:hypothetical protein [Limnobacter humi]MCQ8895260.1 hypothetical protein [Limnobacter humi]